MEGNFRIIVLFLIAFQTFECFTLELEIGDACELRGSKGICKRDRDCSHMVMASVQEKKILTEFRCGFSYLDVVVCCPFTDEILPVRANSQLTRKSEEACKTFGERPPKPFYPEPHIIDGIDAGLAEFPGFAALGYKIENKPIAFDCGGVLISESFVLTAAHCIKPSINQPSLVRFGKTTLDEEDSRDIFLHNDVAVKRSIRYTNYTRKTKYNDIALVELKSKVKFKYNVWPSCLIQTDLPAETKLTIAGFGLIDEKTRTVSKWMQKAELELIPQVECLHNYTEAYRVVAPKGLPNGIKDTQICAKSKSSRANTCEGDSGSAAYYRSDGINYVVAITSFGVSCSSPLPSFYTRITKYLPWIESIVWA